MNFTRHIPVMLEEVIKALEPKEGDRMIDLTLGFGGHTIPLAKKVGKTGKILAFDLDAKALKETQEMLKTQGLLERVLLQHENFRNLVQIAKKEKFIEVDGILLDAGVSSFQLDDEDRGFSYHGDILDMRMDTEKQQKTAQDILQTYHGYELERLFREYGDERLAKPIVKGILELRKNGSLRAQTLVELVDRLYHRFYHGRSRTHPARKIFLALRIEVNEEFANLRKAVEDGISLLRKGGHFVVITFHGGEHRIVKNIFRTETRDCICPPEIPICLCNHSRQIILKTKKPLLPTQDEISQNPRARSAHMYIAEKL